MNIHTFLAIVFVGCCYGAYHDHQVTLEKKARIQAEAVAKDIAHQSPEAQIAFWQEALK